MGYESNRAFSDNFILAAKRLVGPWFVAETSFKVDTKQAADLTVMSNNGLTVGFRVRRRKYDKRPYNRQFTIRAAIDNGAETELQKILAGWCDLMLYGFQAEAGSDQIDTWHLIDLDVWRKECSEKYLADIWASEPRKDDRCGFESNGDGTHFAWFEIPKFPAEMIVTSDCYCCPKA